MFHYAREVQCNMDRPKSVSIGRLQGRIRNSSRGAGSSKRQVRRNFHTDKQKNLRVGGVESRNSSRGAWVHLFRGDDTFASTF